jgi:hypothetical protein
VDLTCREIGKFPVGGRVFVAIRFTCIYNFFFVLNTYEKKEVILENFILPKQKTITDPSPSVGPHDAFSQEPAKKICLTG